MRRNTLERENQYKDQACVILGCGPSLNDFSKKQLEEIAHQHYVIAIKQAFNKIPELVDYHIINDNNLNVYDYTTYCPTRIVELPANNRVRSLEIGADIVYLVEQNTNIDLALSTTFNFDKWTIHNSPVYRPWGPGLMYEVVLFFAHFLGFSEIITLGWDGGPPNSITREHYYGKQPVINPAANLHPDETNREIECSKQFYLWLKERGVNLSIGSKNSYMHEIIPRELL